MKNGDNKTLIGIWIVIVAYGTFAIVDTSAKWLVLAGIPALQAVLARYFGHFVMSLAHLSRTEKMREIIFCPKKLLIILRSSLLVAATILHFIALKYLPISLTATIFFSAPIMICMLSYPLLGERVGPWRWSAIIYGFIGVIIAIQPYDADFHPATILSLFSALGFALYSILTRRLANVASTQSMQFYTGAIGTIALLYFGVTDWQSPDGRLEWILLIAIGVIAWIGHNLLTNAHKFAPPHILMPFVYLQIIFLGCSDYFIFETTPSRHTIIGALIVATSGIFILYREYVLSRTPTKIME